MATRDATRPLRDRPDVAALAGVWSATFACFLAIGAVLPVLPRYVRGPLDAGDVWVGIVVGCFAFAAVVGRPLGGRLADRRGRRTVVLLGLAIAAVAGCLYLVPLGVAGLVVARLVLGLGDGWVFTGGATWVVDLTPASRRGQAIGMFGLSIWGGLTVGPLLGELLLDLGGYDAVWVFAAVMPLVGAAIAARVPEPPRPPLAAEAGAGRSRLVPPSVVAPGLSLACANAGYGALAGFVVLHLDARGIGHGATAFTAFAASVVGARLLLGTLPDRLGARRTALLAGGCEAVGLGLIAAAGSFPVALAGAIVMGTGFSLLFPSLAVIAVEGAGAHERGAALGAFTAFFDAGVGLGAPLAGAVAGIADYAAAFWVGAVFAVLGVALTWRL